MGGTSPDLRPGTGGGLEPVRQAPCQSRQKEEGCAPGEEGTLAATGPIGWRDGERHDRMIASTPQRRLNPVPGYFLAGEAPFEADAMPACPSSASSRS
jgi:hypothetical protein